MYPRKERASEAKSWKLPDVYGLTENGTSEMLYKAAKFLGSKKTKIF